MKTTNGTILKGLVATIVCVAMMLSLTPMTVWAADVPQESAVCEHEECTGLETCSQQAPEDPSEAQAENVVTAVQPLAADVATQTLEPGGTPVLPKALWGTVDGEETEIPVVWSCADFDAGTAGIYTFTAAADGFTLDEELSWPSIAVTVVAAVEEEPPATVVEEAPEVLPEAPQDVEEDVLQPLHIIAVAPPEQTAHTIQPGDDANEMLPATLEAQTADSTVDLPVTWACEAYLPDEEGDYTFTAVFPQEGYTYADDIGDIAVLFTVVQKVDVQATPAVSNIPGSSPSQLAYTTEEIQAAVDDPSLPVVYLDFHTPAVAEFYLQSSITIRRPLTIQGTGQGSCTLFIGGGEGRHFIIDGNHNVTISDLTLSGPGEQSSSDGMAHGGIAANYTPGSSAKLTIKNCTIQYNNNKDTSKGGGGVYVGGGSLLMKNSTVQNNRAVLAGQNGGGVYVNGHAEFSNCGINNNIAAGDGGGVYAKSVSMTYCTLAGTGNHAGGNGGAIYSVGDATLLECTVYGNTAVNGAGIYQNSGVLTLDTECTIARNVATGNGGGIYSATGDTHILNSNVRHNKAANGAGIYQNTGALYVVGSGIWRNNNLDDGYVPTGNGGGIWKGTGPVNIERSTLSENMAIDGGGLYANSASLVNSTVARNDVTGSGGGIHTVNLSMICCTVSGNTATAGGGGVLASGGAGTVAIYGSIIVANYKKDGTASDTQIAATYGQDANTIGYSGGLSGLQAIVAAEDATIPGTAVTKPMPVLAENGGFTKTVLPGAGKGLTGPAPTWAQPTTDQRGVARPQANADRGAVQVGVSNYVVTNTNDSGAGSLRNAVQNANTFAGGPHTITFAIPGAGPHVITLQRPLSVRASMTIQGTGKDQIILEILPEKGRHIGINAEDASLTLIGMTFNGPGAASDGATNGGIATKRDYKGALTIKNCDIKNNVNNMLPSKFFGEDEFCIGGGVAFYASGGSLYGLTLENCVFENNRAYYGGGVGANNAAINITGCTFENNTAQSGGAIWGPTTSTEIRTFSNSKVINNHANLYANIDSQGFGGGIQAKSIQAKNSVFSGNRTTERGGAIYVGTSSTLENVTMSNNHTNAIGGAIYGYDGDTGCELTLINCTVVNNSAGFSAGAIHTLAADITSSTISGNTARWYAGGLHINPNDNPLGALTMNGSIVAGNTLEDGQKDEIRLNGVDSSAPNAGIHNGTGAISNTFGTLNIIGVPAQGLSAILQVNAAGKPDLKENSSWLPTVWPAAYGPAVDAIVGQHSWLPATDQRGIRRPQGTGADIGAVEYAHVTVSFNANGGSSAESIAVVGGKPYGTLPTSTKSGHIFGGWYLEAGLTTKVEAATIVTVETNHTLFAKWNPIRANGISLDITSHTLHVNESFTLVPTVSPADANDKSVGWASDNVDVATVDTNGKVTALALGTTTITAITADGGFAATCAVTVAPHITSVKLAQSSIRLTKGQKVTVGAVVYYSDGSTTSKGLTWTSDNEKVAKVNPTTGKITAAKNLKKNGKATITATAENGKSATVKVTVLKSSATAVKVTKITVSGAKKTLRVGKTAQLKVKKISPSNATGAAISWKSNKPAVLSVDKAGKLTALKEGTAKITVKAGTKSTSFTVKVTAPVNKITVDKKSVTLAKKGKTVTITPTVDYSVDNYTAKLSWKSSNKKVATVSSKGKITAKGKGKATITVSASNGRSAKVKVTVKK